MSETNTSLIQRIKQWRLPAWSLPLALLLLGLLAYGLHLGWMGFYWDDWPWIWSAHVLGPKGMLTIDPGHRPFSGEVLYLGALLAGENPLGWQVYNFVLRLLTGLSLTWALSVLWPRNRDQILWIALLFLVYPGFGQQFVSVNNSRHLLPLTTLFLSFGLMIQALRSRKRYWPLTGVAVLLSVITMLTTEYYYGLELIRPLILWVVIREQKEKPAQRIRTIFKTWLPYLIPLLVIFAWRYTVSKSINYSVTLFSELSNSPTQGGLALFLAAIEDLFSAGLGAWGKTFRLPDPVLFGGRARLYYWGLVAVAAGGGFLYLVFSRSDQPDEKRWNREAIPLGGTALILGAIPFWVTSLDIKLSFPFDRLTLPLMLGSSLLLVGVIDLLIPKKPLKIGLIALLIGLSIGLHYQNGITYRRDWQHQTGFFQQLAWRIPGIQPGTALMANQLPTTYSTDNSLIAPLNWLYAPEFSGGEIPAYLFYIDLRFGEPDPGFDAQTDLEKEYRFYDFQGDPSKVLLIYNQPPACLRVLDEAHHHYFPSLPPEVKALMPFSNLEQIQTAPEIPATLPPPFDPEPGSSWCCFFENADLARQRSEWQAVADFADEAFELGHPDSPAKHANEYELFIEGYGHTGRWEKAKALTFEAVKLDPLLKAMLCETWERIEIETEISATRDTILENVNRKLNCELY